jgi:putative endonuclease
MDKKAMGASWETAATQWLLDHGFAVVERNFHCKAGELDIVARRDRLLVFVEVRSRSSDDHGNALETVGRAKQCQIIRVAQHYLLERAPDWYDDIRFDVVAITGGALDWYEDAFRAGRYG